MGYSLHGLLFVLIQLLTTLPLVLAVTKTVYFQKPFCQDRLMLKPGDVYEVIWNGEKYPERCYLRFLYYGRDKYRMCVEVTKFQLECDYRDTERKLLLGDKSYGCGTEIPTIYCNEEAIYLKLEPYYENIRASSDSQIKMTITNTLISKYDDPTSTSGSTAGIVIGTIAGVLVVLVIVAILCKANRSNASALRGFNRECQDRMILNGTNYTGVSSSVQTPQQLPDENLIPNNSDERQQPTAPPDLYSFQSQSMDQHSHQYSAVPQQDMNTNYNRGHSPYSSNADNSQNPETQGQGLQDSTAPPPSYHEVMSKGKDYDVK